MVIGILKVEKTDKVKNNPYYGNYEITDTYTRHIVNEKYVGLVSPPNGIHIKVESCEGDKLDITIGKYAFTGEREQVFDETVDFSISFDFNGHIYEATLDSKGQFRSLNEWISSADFEDGNEPDNHYDRKSRGIKWELLDM